MTKLTKTEARERADELEIEYTSKTSVAELRDLIAAAETPVETPEEESKSEAKEVVEAPVEEAKEEEVKEETPSDQPTTIEGSPIISVEKVGEYYKVQTANAVYTLPEAEYNAL